MKNNKNNKGNIWKSNVMGWGKLKIQAIELYMIKLAGFIIKMIVWIIMLRIVIIILIKVIN